MPTGRTRHWIATIAALTAPAAARAAIVDHTCDLQAANSLRVECAVTLDAPAAVRVGVREPGTLPYRWAPWSDVATDHVRTVVHLQPDVALEYAVQTDAGDRATGALPTPFLPPALADLNLVVDGAGTPLVLFDTEACDGTHHVVVVDTVTAAIVWYQDVTGLTGGGAMTGLSFDDDVVLAVVDNAHVYGWDLAGREVLHVDHALDCDVDLGPCPHHDANLAPTGDVWFPTARLEPGVSRVGTPWEKCAVTSFVNDGVMAVDAAGSVTHDATLMGDLGFDPAIDPGPNPGDVLCDGMYYTSTFALPDVDWTHLNALDVGRDGGAPVVLLSLAPWDEVLRYNPATGAVDWRLAGDSSGDFTVRNAAGVAGPESFQGQHHVQWLGGDVLFLDNRDDDPRAARVLRIRPGVANAWITHAWMVTDDAGAGMSCDKRGGARLVPGSGGARALAMCTDAHWIAELTDSTGLPGTPPAMSITLEAGNVCDGDPTRRISRWYRAYPLTGLAVD